MIVNDMITKYSGLQTGLPSMVIKDRTTKYSVAVHRI